MMEYTTLNNGVIMPMEGFGVMEISNNDDGEAVILEALHTGYRMIDTASAYFNEETVGKAVKKSGIHREDLFITSKLWVQDAGYERTKKAFLETLRKLGTDYLDMYMVHVPFGDYYGSWRAMEEFCREGRVRALGVCNFYPARLADLCMNADIVPAVCQVEMHPFFQQKEEMETMKRFHVQPEAWSPLAHGRFQIFSHPLLSAIGARYGKTAGQTALRWNLQRGAAVIPKAASREHMKENFQIWNFSLTEEEMKRISTLDKGRTEVEDPTAAESAISANQWKIHE